MTEETPPISAASAALRSLANLRPTGLPKTLGPPPPSHQVGTLTLLRFSSPPRLRVPPGTEDVALDPVPGTRYC